MTDVNIVQFPHPGSEHQPGPGRLMPWNSRSHRRKFMVSPGTWLDGSGATHQGSVTFWGEWEPPSRVLERWPEDGHLPRYLHQPVLTEMPSGHKMQNTDPLVFGERFQYSNCKQWSRKHRKPTGMQELEPGSVILFGSSLADEFVLDTVVVVSRARRYAPAIAESDSSSFVDRVIMAPLRTDANAEDYSLTLYDGATPDDPIDGMYSFVPCLPAASEPRRFGRPAVRLDGFINPRSRQSPSGFTRRDSVAQSVARDCWLRVVDQVREAGLELAVQLNEPDDA